jgi:hypothetical protein
VRCVGAPVPPVRCAGAPVPPRCVGALVLFGGRCAGVGRDVDSVDAGVGCDVDSVDVGVFSFCVNGVAALLEAAVPLLR